MPPAYHGNPWAPGGVGVARRFVYESLFDYTPATGQFFPRLGTSFREDRRARTLTVELAPQARWHDGHPFTSADVEATFQIGYLGSLEIWHYLDRIECPSAHQVVFHWKLDSPTNTLQVLTEPITSAAHLFRPYVEASRGLERQDERWRDLEREARAREVLYAERPPLPVGTGPFRLRRATASDLVLDRFESYHGRSRVHLEGVRIARWGRNEVVWSYLYAGQLDAISPACPHDLAEQVLQRNPRMRLVTPSDMNEMGLVINCRRPPLSSLRFRQALSCALDRDTIRRLACAPGDTSPPYSLGVVPSLASRLLGPDFLRHLSPLGHDEERARRLLTESGQSVPERLEIIAPAGFTDLALLAEAAASQLTRFGLSCEVRLVQGEFYSSLMQEGNFDLAAVFGAQMGPLLHPSTSTGRFFARNAQLQQASGLSHPEAERWVSRLRLTTDPQEAAELCRRLARLQNDTASFIPCFEKRLMIFVQDGTRVSGWPEADSPLWSAAPLGVESLYCSLAARGLLRSAP